MSQISINKNMSKKSNIEINSSKLLSEGLIQYTEGKNDTEFFEMMKRGYLEMSQINLQISLENESALIDVNNYETWLSGE